MARVLTVIEDDLPSIIFHIYEEPDKPDVLSTQGYIKTVDPTDGSVGYLRQIGVYDTNAEAQRAAEEYAAAKGKKIVKWEEARIQSGRGNEPSLEAGARPVSN